MWGRGVLGNAPSFTMNPEVEILSAVQVNWPSFKSTLDKGLGERHDRILAQCPVPITEDAEFLLYLAALQDISLSNPLNVLRTLPHELMEYLHYTFMVVCDEQTYLEFRQGTNLQIVVKKKDEMYFLLVAGPLTQWFRTIVLNLTRSRKYTTLTRVLIDKFLLILEKRGLKEVFSNYIKKPEKDGTFYLEQK